MSYKKFSDKALDFPPPFPLSAKVRRLYDIANILSSLGLIKKKVFVGPHHIKKPGYAWSGPSLADIEAICKLTIIILDSHI